MGGMPPAVGGAAGAPGNGGSAGASGGAGGEGGDGGQGGDGGTIPRGPSCDGLPATCGDMDDCCRADIIPGGSFDRISDESLPATVSTFALDTYEVTVARFRAFFDAGMGTQATPPADGAGAHPLIPSSGWQSAWNVELETDADTLRQKLACHTYYSSWGDFPGPNETRPINCVTWYEAFAFCAWDGGRLATDTEWNYAAAGGDEQRVYPWSVPPTSTPVDCNYSSYDCGNISCDGVASCQTSDLLVVGTRPLGDGRWGHADLGGNLSEHVLDWNGTDPMPCVDCANMAAGSERLFRGGNFFSVDVDMQTNARRGLSPSVRSPYQGIRCARDL